MPSEAAGQDFLSIISQNDPQETYAILPDKAIEVGISILGPILDKHGFAQIESSREAGGSGGPSAWAKYARGGRQFEFHYRYALGMVSYSQDNVAVSHEDLAWAVDLGEPKYPLYEGSAERQFEALAEDLDSIMRVFFVGDSTDVADLIWRANSRPAGFARLSEKSTSE